jgi:hypothetical protein
MTVAKISNLQRFAKEHPHANLSIVVCADYGDARLMAKPPSDMPVDIIWQSRVVQTYSRGRDARRALRSCRYSNEGCFWRLRRAQDRAFPKIAADISDLIGDL